MNSLYLKIGEVYGVDVSHIPSNFLRFLQFERFALCALPESDTFSVFHLYLGTITIPKAFSARESVILP